MKVLGVLLVLLGVTLTYLDIFSFIKLEREFSYLIYYVLNLGYIILGAWLLDTK